MKPIIAAVIVLAALSTPAHGIPFTPEKSVFVCQKTAAEKVRLYMKNVARRIDKCLERAELDLLQGTAKAGKTCLKLAKLGGYNFNFFFTHIAVACIPGNADVTHHAADVVGTSVGTPTVAEPLNTRALENLCGTILDTPQKWVECLVARVECNMRSSLAVTYPRALDLLALARDQLTAMEDSQERYTAIATIDFLREAIDGTPAGDGVPDIDCTP